jgi:hypothetical protein
MNDLPLAVDLDHGPVGTHADDCADAALLPERRPDRKRAGLSPETGAGKVVYADDHCRPDGVHSWPEARASEVPLKHNIPMQWKQGAERLQRLSAQDGVLAHR